MTRPNSGTPGCLALSLPCCRPPHQSNQLIDPSPNPSSPPPIRQSISYNLLVDSATPGNHDNTIIGRIAVSIPPVLLMLSLSLSRQILPFQHDKTRNYSCWYVACALPEHDSLSLSSLPLPPIASATLPLLGPSGEFARPKEPTPCHQQSPRPLRTPRSKQC